MAVWGPERVFFVTGNQIPIFQSESLWSGLCDRTVIRQDGRIVAEHPRSFGRGETIYDPSLAKLGARRDFHLSESNCEAGLIGLELRCAERKFISLTSRPNSDLRDTAQTVAVSREDNLLCQGRTVS